MIATVSTTQYDRESGSTSLITAATPVQSISLIVNSQAIRPPTSCSPVRSAADRSRESGPGDSPGAGPAAGSQVPDSTRARLTMASRSASAPGEDDQAGGTIGSRGPSALC